MTIRPSLLTILLAVVITGCGHGHEAPPTGAAAADHDHDEHARLHASDNGGAAADDSCTCDLARTQNGWCGGHRVGWVAGIRVPSADLFDVLDAHGHEIDPATITCASCRDALDTDGYCTVHAWGFVDEHLYVSKLTWVLGRGQPRDPATISCTTCRAHAVMPGWCDSCGIGMTGLVAYDDRALFDEATGEMDRLMRAVGTLPRCETCAIRHFENGRCDACGLTWTDGQSSSG
jgi:hypothetical protein